MDLKAYYRKIRETAEGLKDSSVVVVSLETSDGGRAGIRTEAPRELAARLIVEGRVRPATEEEAKVYRDQLREAKRAADDLAAASRMQVTVVPASQARTSGRRE